MHQEPARVMFVYWGRRGAMTQFTLQLARAALAHPCLIPTISVSRQNERFDSFCDLGSRLFPMDTFRTGAGAVLEAWRLPFLRRRFRDRLRQDRIEAVIELMPHVWSPLLMPVARTVGARYCTIVHDAVAHPGDPTGWIKLLTDPSLRSVDLAFTLSAAAATRLRARNIIAPGKIVTLFTPDLRYGGHTQRMPPKPGEPLRLLFLGRILPYKGLSLFVDMVETLRRGGIATEVGVFGEGPLGANAERLSAMNAEVVNRWLAEEEFGAILSRFHAVVLSHTEASQSGVAAAALGAGLPIIVTPVGGLVEQVSCGKNGIIADELNPRALAEAAKRLLLDPVLYRSICDNISKFAEQRAMAHFVEIILSQALRI